MRQLLDALPDEPRLVVSGNFASPRQVIDEIDALLPTYRLWALNAQPGLPDREGVVLETSFVGPGMRRSPRLRYVPSRLSMVPALFRRNMAPDLVVLHTTPPRGPRGEETVSLGTEVNVLPAAIESVKARGGKVIAQVNDQMPWTYGDAEVRLSDIDLMIEASTPLLAHDSTEPDEASAAIGGAVADRVTDGSTLQAGIGAVPDAALRGLLGRRGLRIWTEMFSDSVMAMEQAGALDRDVELTTSFVFGSAELYHWIDGNRRVRMTRTEVANDPAVIAANPAMTSINTALEVDLYAQANASRIRKQIHSGFGGQTDFIVGAIHSVAGQALLGLRSWHPRADCSTIVPIVHDPVTSFQPTAVITEQGTAAILGHDQYRQAANLIEYAAHPAAREGLWQAAEEMGLREVR